MTKRKYRFIVKRTSHSYFDENPPMTGAKQFASRQRWDERSFDTLEEWRKRFPHDFNQPALKEENILGGGCRRLMSRDTRIWYIDITKIAELLDLVHRECRIIVSENRKEFGDFEVDGEIEFYDDYRE